MKAAVRCFIGLGSNLSDPQGQIAGAFEELAALASSRLLARSRLYRSRPMGPPDQPDYLNAVAELHTVLEPLALLDALQRIEQAHGRVRGPQRWGPRTLDLDLLLYGERRIACDRLTVPHPGLTQRPFVVVPLYELAPELILPAGEPLARWLPAPADELPQPVD